MLDIHSMDTVNNLKCLSGKEPEDQATSASKPNFNELNELNLIQLIILVQFASAAAITIFAVVGVSVNQPIGFLLLLALLQFLITLPGFAYHFTKKQPHFLLYLVFQIITLVSEVLWFIYSLATDTYTAITIVVLIILIFIQTGAVLAATVFKNVVVNLRDVQVSRRSSRRSAEERNPGSPARSSGSSRRRSISPTDESPHRIRRTSKELEQGIDQSKRGQPSNLLNINSVLPRSGKVVGALQKKKHSVSEESLRKFKEGRRKMRQLAMQLKERRNREKAAKLSSDSSEKSIEATASSSEKRTTDASTKVSRSTDTGDLGGNAGKTTSPLGTAIEPTDK
ncbi:hypothetical protein Y032_0748g2024 [Ancylostoma ceylanicum]|uniref:Uncharacterized protein n=1 Tax=Ancylostoma ceylanicum TaxID=53326 RepID=A0A016WEL0_9BILA|nr:hypothetical protein Y032_0748g2024 [Ancylostoma ceylanicum]